MTFIIESLFLNSIEEQKVKERNKKYYTPVNAQILLAPKINSEIQNGNLVSLRRITGINLRKTELLNLKATYAATITCGYQTFGVM